MSPPSSQQIFRQSLKRCLQREDFLDLFYASFIESSAEIRDMFSATEFSVQKKRLLKSLQLAADVVDGDAAAMRHLHERAVSHDRHNLNIKPGHYEQWLSSLLETVTRCDPEFDQAIDAAWRDVLGHIIGYMQAHY